MASSSLTVDRQLRSFLACAEREAEHFDPGNDDDEAPGISLVNGVVRIAFAGVIDRRTWSRISADIWDAFRRNFPPARASLLDLRKVSAVRLRSAELEDIMAKGLGPMFVVLPPKNSGNLWSFCTTRSTRGGGEICIPFASDDIETATSIAKGYGQRALP
jgi:hypothetical protein